MALTEFPFTLSRPFRERAILSTRGRDLNDGLVDRTSQFGSQGYVLGVVGRVRLPKDGETIDTFDQFVLDHLGTTAFTYKPLHTVFKTVTLEAVGTGDAVETVFTLDSKYIDESTLLVYVDGVLQTLTTHYTVSGNESTPTITFVSAPGNTLAVTATYDRFYPMWFADDDMAPLLQRGGAVSATLPHQLDRIQIVEQYPGAHLVG